jgi:antitoxin PrlF
MFTKITSKGQVTIPRRIRDALGLKAGMRVEFGVEGGRAFLEPVSRTGMEALAGSLSAYARKPGKIDEKTVMNQVQERVAKRASSVSAR